MAGGGIGHSFLDGTEWVLRARVVHGPERGHLTQDASIPATEATRERWNELFWRLFPAEPELASWVERGDVGVSIMFRFRPTARLKQKYSGFPVLKVARAAEGSGSLKQVPELADAIEAYERDKRQLEQQRRQAWLELQHLRLPTAPAPYRWDLVAGDPRSYSDVLYFQLKKK